MNKDGWPIIHVRVPPLLKKALGHYGLEQDIYTDEAVFNLVVAGLQAHIVECGLDCAIIAHMGDVISAQVLRELDA